jgi:23S rRNA pseudouridine1911/1915/1917 synthase
MPLPPIIFEDDALIAFNKPSDLLIVPDRKAPARESLMRLIHARFGEEVVNVHRLDTEASGIFLCAKTKPALDFVSGQFQSKTASKKFLAMVAVHAVADPNKLTSQSRSAAGALLDAFEIDAPIEEDETQKGRMRVTRKHRGKESVTQFKVLERFGRFTWLEAHPITGRPHQVRVHLAAIGAPILEDSIYGDPEAKLLLSNFKRGYKGRDEEKPLINRLALHADELIIQHPATRQPLPLLAPLASDLEIALTKLRKYGREK